MFLSLLLSDCGDAPAHDCQLTGFDQSSRAEIDVADLSEVTDEYDQRRAQKGNDHALHVGSEVSVIHRMVHQLG